jgi:hypothetical protein
MTTIAARVAIGAALLDEELPAWPERVRPERLNMADCFLCILGQIYGEYVAGLEALGILGVTPGTDAGFHDEDPVALRDEWRRVIEARQGGAP